MPSSKVSEPGFVAVGMLIFGRIVFYDVASFTKIRWDLAKFGQRHRCAKRNKLRIVDGGNRQAKMAGRWRIKEVMRIVGHRFAKASFWRVFQLGFELSV